MSMWYVDRLLRLLKNVVSTKGGKIQISLTPCAVCGYLQRDTCWVVRLPCLIEIIFLKGHSYGVKQISHDV